MHSEKHHQQTNTYWIGLGLAVGLVHARKSAPQRKHTHTAATMTTTPHNTGRRHASPIDWVVNIPPSRLETIMGWGAFSAALFQPFFFLIVNFYKCAEVLL